MLAAEAAVAVAAAVVVTAVGHTNTAAKKYKCTKDRRAESRCPVPCVHIDDGPVCSVGVGELATGGATSEYRAPHCGTLLPLSSASCFNLPRREQKKARPNRLFDVAAQQQQHHGADQKDPHNHRRR